MTRVLRCPECGADQDSITLLRTEDSFYAVKLNDDGNDLESVGARLYHEEPDGPTYFCNDCGFESEEGADFIGEDDDGDDR
jgi:predicted RNA-binding Zn-ribbon protein involved in translation (DUF1610 family)